jgi:hypothetical protein
VRARSSIIVKDGQLVICEDLGFFGFELEALMEFLKKAKNNFELLAEAKFG